MRGPRSVRGRFLLFALLGASGLIFATHMFWRLHRLHGPLQFHIGHGFEFVVALVLVGAGLLGLRNGLAQFDRLRRRLAAVHEGRARRVEGEYPSEVQPLVDDLNRLLEQREEAVRRALTKAGDLAHGLKTPLALLALEADQAEAEGQAERAARLRTQVEGMRRQVEYHLAQARAAASGPAPGVATPLAPAAEALVRTLRALHAARDLAFEVDVPPGLVVACQREDLDELLGNLLDNACKWARGRVALSAAAAVERVRVVVADDGVGLDPALRASVLRRGVRADEAAPGSGFGLAIVRDLVDLYGGTLTLDDAPAGGLRVTLELPGARME